MEIKQMPIKDIKPAEYNPRKIDDEAAEGLRESLHKYGVVQNLVINKDNTLIGGHQKLRIIKDLVNVEGTEQDPYLCYELKTLPCIVVDLSKKEEKKLNILLNSTYITGEYDFDKLLPLLDKIKEDDDYFELRLDKLEPLYTDEELPDLEEVEGGEPPAEPITQTGDIYELNNHRLICGSSTSIETVDALFDGKKADITFTSPPYNVDESSSKLSSKKGKSSKYIHSDNNPDYPELLTDFTANALVYSQFVFVNIQSLSNNKVALIDYLHDFKENYAET